MWHCSSGDIQTVSCWLDPYGSCTWHSLGRGSRHLGETWPIATHSSCSLPDPERFRLRLRVTRKHCQPPAVVVGYASVPSLGFCIPGGCGSRSHPQACPLLPGFLANPHLGKGGAAAQILWRQQRSPYPRCLPVHGKTWHGRFLPHPEGGLTMAGLGASFTRSPQT